jgi:hypothetical protein
MKHALHACHIDVVSFRAGNCCLCSSPTPPRAKQLVAMCPSNPYDLVRSADMMPMNQSTIQILPFAPAYRQQRAFHEGV